MNSISVVIITLNEEMTIERCIKSVLPIADEIVVVDSFSKDKTKEICLNLKVQFFEHQFKDYITQKNYANTLAKSKFILSLDADEALDQTLCQSILKAKEKSECDGYFMNRMNRYCDKWIRHGAWYPDKKLRLFRKDKGAWKGLYIHEKVQLTDDAKIGYLRGHILHYTYDSIEGHISQFNNFTSLSAQKLFAENRKIGVIGIFFKPLYNFIQGFFFKFGFLDGYYGVVICLINSFATFSKYIKLRQLYKSGKL